MRPAGWPAFALLCLAAPAAGCRQDMHDQPRVQPLVESTFFDDGRSARPLMEGTVARGHLRLDSHLYTGKVDGRLVERFPFAVDRTLLERGRERYNIFCSPCHDRVGSGRGIVVERGFRRPQSFHSQRLREVPVGYFFDVMTNGYATMYSYASRVPVRDRWAIAAYIRALQFSQSAPLDRLPREDREKLPGRGQ